MNKEKINTLLDSYSNVIKSLSRKFCNSIYGYEFDDLVQEGNLVIIKIITKRLEKKEKGTLYGLDPYSVSGNYIYKCIFSHFLELKRKNPINRIKPFGCLMELNLSDISYEESINLIDLLESLSCVEKKLTFLRTCGYTDMEIEGLTGIPRRNIPKILSKTHKKLERN